MHVSEPAPEPTPDLLVTPVATALLACLCAELEKTIGGATCQCCLRPGAVYPPMDACCNCGSGQGQASVQVLSIWPTTKFPQRGAGATLTPCSGFSWAAELAVVVYRCMTCPSGDRLPSCDELTLDARKIWSDAAAMRRAVMCCDWRDDQLIVPGEWQPIGPSGCCGGGRMTVVVDLGV
ncbi:MAG: hypothetical protein LC792_00020 [Actinobacteria bacterium]|nr:hypothetical protein [Actinomycetota bacterium]